MLQKKDTGKIQTSLLQTASLIEQQRKSDCAVEANDTDSVQKFEIKRDQWEPRKSNVNT